MQRHLAIATMLASLPAAAADALTPTPAALQAGLAGKWRGALGYRDYQSNKLEELPVQTDITALGDGATIIRVATFDDGPKSGTVYITTASLYAGNTVSEVSLRKGRAVETTTDRVAVTAFTDQKHWAVRYDEDGTDDDKPAKLRVTETRDGDSLLSIKEVLPASATDGVWRFRNQTRLTRVP